MSIIMAPARYGSRRGAATSELPRTIEDELGCCVHWLCLAFLLGRVFPRPLIAYSAVLSDASNYRSSE
jgi:hypothetical protein